MPCVTTGNTMAPCMIIRERAAKLLQTGHNWSGSETYRDLAVA